MKKDTPIEVGSPEEMLERWQGHSCSCDPDVGFLCEVCHDIQVVRQLLIERDSLRECADHQAAQIRVLNKTVEAGDTAIRALEQAVEHRDDCAKCGGTGMTFRHWNNDYVDCDACNGKGR